MAVEASSRQSLLLKVLLLFVKSNCVMEATQAQQQDALSWSALRKRANQLGIPAWKLAEDLAFHDLRERSKKNHKLS